MESFSSMASIFVRRLRLSDTSVFSGDSLSLFPGADRLFKRPSRYFILTYS